MTNIYALDQKAAEMLCAAKARNIFNSRLHKQNAYARYKDDQYRRRDNRIMLFCAVAFVVVSGLLVGLVSQAYASDKAKSGKIYAKSEMSKAEIKKLNIMPTVSEKRK